MRLKLAAYIASDVKTYNAETEKNKAPLGVIFDNNKAIVGKNHDNKPLILSKDLIEKIQEIGDEYGYWYEGVGADVSSSHPFPTNKSGYKGSFDDEFAKSIKGEPPEFYYVMFSNIEVNNNIQKLTNPDPDSERSIFNSILHGYTEDKKKRHLYYLRNVSPKASTLEDFLKMVSDDENNFLEMSKKQATKENVKEFLTSGEERMWPSNWSEYPFNAGKVAQKANRQRDEYLANQKSGVYIVGAGHLKDIVKLKAFTMIGGESIT